MPTRRLLPLLLTLLLLSPAFAAPKPPPDTTPNDAAAFRLLHRAQRVTAHPEKATQAQLAQAARDLARANELSPDFELQPWFHADLGTVFYAQAQAKRGAARTYLLQKAYVQFHLAAATHSILLNGAADAVYVSDYEAADDATVSFILYHVALLDYELGRPPNAIFALDLLLEAAAQRDLKRPEYVEKARTLLLKAKQAEAEQRKEWEKSHPSPR